MGEKRREIEMEIMDILYFDDQLIDVKIRNFLKNIESIIGIREMFKCEYAFVI